MDSEHFLKEKIKKQLIFEKFLKIAEGFEMIIRVPILIFIS